MCFELHHGQKMPVYDGQQVPRFLGPKVARKFYFVRPKDIGIRQTSLYQDRPAQTNKPIEMFPTINRRAKPRILRSSRLPLTFGLLVTGISKERDCSTESFIKFIHW